MKTKKLNILEMLRYRRPAGSRTEAAFIARYLDTIPNMYGDNFGNRLLVHPDSRVMISCHTDTVHTHSGKQRVDTWKHEVAVPLDSDSNCLGADDTAGVYAALRMIAAGVPVTYVFHREEEIGGNGSQWLATNYPDWLKTFDVCLALDRRGTTDIITSQSWSTCASDEFALSLSAQLGLGHKPAMGIFTDSANYVDLIPECSNLSIGYRCEHTPSETLDLDYLERIIDRLCAVDWDALTIARDPNEYDVDLEPGFLFGIGPNHNKLYNRKLKGLKEELD